MNPYRAPYVAVCRDDDGTLRRLQRADWAWAHMRAARHRLTTLVALCSVFPWLRSAALSWLVPGALVSIGVAVWAALALVALVVGVHEWGYARERDLCLRRLAGCELQSAAADGPAACKGRLQQPGE